MILDPLFKKNANHLKNLFFKLAKHSNDKLSNKKQLVKGAAMQI